MKRSFDFEIGSWRFCRWRAKSIMVN